MKSLYYLFLFFGCLIISLDSISQNPAHSEAGSGLLPIPQRVSFTNEKYILDNNWFIGTTGNITKADPAVQSLTSALKECFGLNIQLNTGANAGSNIHGIQLIIKAGSVKIAKTTDTNRYALMQQAYHLKLDKEKITITANAAQGLFYGVQTFIQLLKKDNGKIFFSGGAITDWPDMDVRMIYWDDAHHLERLDAMKRAIRQASYYKINAFSLKLEGHFQFSSAKPIVEPYAYSPEEYQELTDYAKAHYIDLIPYLDAPAHVSFILKHPEYKELRSFPNSNYELDVTNPKVDELILGMVDDLISANKGGKYFFLSTDEAYYVGKAKNQQKIANKLGGNGRLLAAFITRIANAIHKKGRKVIFWGEYPLVKSDVSSLPSHLINGINSNSEEFGSSFKDHGIRHLVFTSAQGMEPLFPNYYKLSLTDTPKNTRLSDDEIAQGDLDNGRVAQILKAIRSGIDSGHADLMGTVVCGWADSGLNPETFWLGYAAGLAAAWNNQRLNAESLSDRFFKSFYGEGEVHMQKIYQLLSRQAEFWKISWNSEPSRNRTPILGNSYGMFDTPHLVKDQVFPLLPLPAGSHLSFSDEWYHQNSKTFDLAEKFLDENNELLELIQQNLIRADYQRYNLLVLFSIAQLCRQNLNMLLSLKRINSFLMLSSKVALDDPAVAISLVDQALDQAAIIRERRNQVLDLVTSIWYQDWFPRVSEANGRKYLDQVDDIKDHIPVRTVDMSYLIYRQLKYPFGKWAEDLVNARNEFAKRNNLPTRTEIMNRDNIGEK
jgi:hypothetical protein